MRKLLFTIMALFCALTSFAQFPTPKEGWIAVPGSSADGYGVYVFKKDIELNKVSENMRVWVTGDNRYKLFVNGKIVSIGPARSDLQHWNCEEVNLAPYLHEGKNTVAALVWNEGNERAVANMTYRTGFFLHAIDSAASALNTDASWQCIEDKSYSPVPVNVPGYYAAGPGERIDMHKKIFPHGLSTITLTGLASPSPTGEGWGEASIVAAPNYVGQQGSWGTYPGWMLKKSELPQRELKLERLGCIREAQNVKVNNKFLQGSSPITIPAHTTAKIIIDNNVETNAYVTMKFSGGDNTKIALGYTEAFYNKPSTQKSEGEVLTKGNRNEIKGKIFIGRADTIISNGEDYQEFTTLVWRTYRYIVLTVKTANAPITINDLYGTFTGYPFELKASISTSPESRSPYGLPPAPSWGRGSATTPSNTTASTSNGFASSSNSIAYSSNSKAYSSRDLASPSPSGEGWGEAGEGWGEALFSLGWRTARLCAIETYMDCPYYEQMQYFGDARIQALVTLYMTGDDRLVKQLLNAADWSRNAEGVTQSRYPASLPQWIQPYALHYIYTLHDYMMYANDTTFLKTKLMAERTILDYFHRYQTEDGRVKNLPGWNFSDWVDNNPNWKEGVAMPGKDGCNAVMDLQLLYAYEMAADIEAKLGMKSYVDLYNQRIAQLKKTIVEKYWCPDVGLFSDVSTTPSVSGVAPTPTVSDAATPSPSERAGERLSGERPFSQHANALAILTDAWVSQSPSPWERVGERLENDTTLAPASIYFKFYTHQAMTKAGLGDDYMQWLGIWRKYLELGLTTCGETSDVESTRSDCHAWGASPNIEFFRTVLGIDSDAPCFSHVSITPHLGDIKNIGGTMPTPYGNITVKYQLKGKNLKATITLPSAITGTLHWQGKDYQLHSGENHYGGVATK